MIKEKMFYILDVHENITIIYSRNLIVFSFIHYGIWQIEVIFFLLFKNNFKFRIVLDLQKICEDYTESSHLHYIQFPKYQCIALVIVHLL